MWDILKIMAGVFLGEFLWGIVLFTFLYILIRRIIQGAKTRLIETGIHISFKGSGFLKGANSDVNVNPRRVKNFVRYSGNAVRSTVARIRK